MLRGEERLPKMLIEHEGIGRFVQPGRTGV
jgi:hypothetical protein